jgi:alkaline phosphatase D
MFRNFYLLSLVFAMAYLPSVLHAQEYASLKRLSLDTTLAPFYHGVASGDPLTDAVIIWTRVTTPDTGTIIGNWYMATDTLFNNTVQTGQFTTDASKDFTVKIDVTGLQAGTYYYYRFEYAGNSSLIGRTKTAPSGSINQLRLAVVSCNDYENGYFNAFEHLMYRNDFDAVVHLGDYIYEYGASTSIPGREHEPANEIVTLSDYRGRFSHYRLDAQLRGLHQNYPFITIWDDHESANNSWSGGAENHTPGSEGNWNDRLDNSKIAYFEWMPIRDHAAPNQFKGYRKIRYGNLLDLIVLDTRIDGRDEQDRNAANDVNRRLISSDQLQWLADQLKDTTTQWKVIAQQVMVAPLNPLGILLNEDQWDGYVGERNRLYDTIAAYNVDNVVVLTGDIHTAWANNLLDGSTPVGVEFVTTSVTSSSGGLTIPGGAGTISSLLPHIKYANVVDKGYLILDVTTASTQGDFYFVNTISTVDTTTNFTTGWYTNDGTNTLVEGTPTAATVASAPLAPKLPGVTVGIKTPQPTELILVGAFPNPFHDQFVVQYFLQQPGSVTAYFYDLAGKQVASQELGFGNEGINLANVNGSKLPAGSYILVLDNGKQTYRKQVVKVD